jgi:hypothetical protein
MVQLQLNAIKSICNKYNYIYFIITHKLHIYVRRKCVKIRV